MLIQITYNDNSIFEANNEETLYAYVENQVVNPSDDPVQQTVATDGSLMLKLESVKGIANFDVRKTLYEVYKELVADTSNIKDISIFNIDDCEDKDLLFSTERMNLKIKSISMFDRGLTNITEGGNESSNQIVIFIALEWGQMEE